MGPPLARADGAAWLVAALLDDVALNTPWGGASGWPRQPLVVSLAGDPDAGERFFDRLDELMRHPARDPEMLELAFLCLALGFRGKHRVSGAAGEAALAELRARIARALRHREDATPLAPNWRGVAAPDERPRAVPLWSVALVALAVLTALHVALSVRLSDRSEELYALARSLPPPERAGVFRPPLGTEGEGTPPAPPPPVVIELLPALEAAAPAATRAALSGTDDVSATTVVIRAESPEVFRSARAEVNEAYAPLIASIAGVIRDNEEVVGGVTVIGHTDSVPVQRTNPLASNQGLSEARAETIARLLAAGGVPEALISAEGRGAEDPIADNATREGRARNRRVEIRIEKRV